MARGWILDVYPSDLGQITVWIIAENGERLKFKDNYARNIYVAGEPRDLEDLTESIDRRVVEDFRFVRKCADFMDACERRVLELKVRDYKRIPFLARRIIRLGGYEKLQVYNVDVPVAQAYLYDRNLYPLAHVIVHDSSSLGGLSYKIVDSIEDYEGICEFSHDCDRSHRHDYDCNYKVPPLRSLWLSVEIKKEGPVPRFSDEIENVSIESDGIRITIDKGSEEDKIVHLVELIRKEDPDIILTKGGDSFILPYIAHRALVNGVPGELILGREDLPFRSKGGRGRTFLSYGRVYYRSPARRLYGRIHVDVDNSFICREAGLEGLIEVSRTCRVPLQRAARTSIGSIMSSLQMYIAWRDGILIPWKKREPESFKTGWDLLVADRGGLVYEPRVGFHEDVVEVDFVSMFPTIMLRHNISAETVLCKCCPDSKIRVPELGYNICEKRRGIVPKTLEVVLNMRLRYKEMARSTKDPELLRIYERRQAALKWILVTCFGYLGYRNAKFGRIDAHIAVCAFAREALMRTARLAEEFGFEVIHGIVDSLWIKKPRVTQEEIEGFCREASKAVGVTLKAEGKYRWVVFLPSRVHPGVPVLNRYYGVFDDGRLKMRGIEARRADTPPLIAEAQKAMISKLAPARDLHE
ncbi:MAG: DNA polymerase domain-containing protein, partial [Candidatus Methanomethylicaceae archaeon]